MSFAFGIGIGTQNLQGDWLEIYYPQPLLNPPTSLMSLSRQALGGVQGNVAVQPSMEQLSELAAQLDQAGYSEQAALARQCSSSVKPLVITLLDTDSKATHTAEVYLKLHLLSHRLAQPHQLNLEGIFACLPNVAWTNQGAIDLAELAQRQLAAHLQGAFLEVKSVDKFPPMADYCVPAGVRIADAARVRLGAHLGSGTTIMHEGFVNFNAGTLGTSMVEGRISAGVVIGEGSDLGGGCSTMGTLSGGGNMVISVGKKCLIGANAGIGIPLGDNCTVESGLYITAGSKVMLLDLAGAPVKQVKARELAGKHDLLFRRNSQSGAIECKTNQTAIQLNSALHDNN